MPIRAVLLGLLSWIIPFTVSFALFPLRTSNPSLFTTLIYLVVLGTAGVLLALHFLHRRVRLGEAVLVGLLWLVMNLVFDYPLFAYGPMKMAPLSYYSEIGLVYLTFPAFALLAGQLARQQ